MAAMQCVLDGAKYANHLKHSYFQIQTLNDQSLIYIEYLY